VYYTIPIQILDRAIAPIAPTQHRQTRQSQRPSSTDAL
jgi:hypothetical protein